MSIKKVPTFIHSHIRHLSDNSNNIILLLLLHNEAKNHVSILHVQLYKLQKALQSFYSIFIHLCKSLLT